MEDVYKRRRALKNLAEGKGTPEDAEVLGMLSKGKIEERVPSIRRIEKDLIDIDGVSYPIGEIKPQMVLERDEQWERVPCIGEPIAHFAHEIARRRIPDNANAYELVGNGEQRHIGFTWRFNQKIRYYHINIEKYNKLHKESLS